MIDSKDIDEAVSPDDFKRLELKLKLREVGEKTQLGWSSPLVIAISAAALGGFFNLALTVYGNLHAKSIQLDADEKEDARLADARLLEERKMALALVLETLREFPDKEKSATAVCHVWQDSIFQGEFASVLDRLVLRRSLCASDGRGNRNLSLKQEDSPEERLLKLECSNSEIRSDRAVAKDQSGFNSRPQGRATLDLEAPEGHFFGPYTVIEASFRRNDGQKIEDIIQEERTALGGTSLATRYRGEIICTNDKGTGRTCESRVTIQATAYPQKCAKYFSETPVTLND